MQTAPEKVLKDEDSQKKVQYPATRPIKGISAIIEKAPNRVLDRKRIATQRYGIDVMQVDNEADVHQTENFQKHLCLKT